jgi:DNA-binding NarL/FixJ family response regulator
LTEPLAAAGRGAGAVLLIGGEPGIGKTRIAEVLAERAAQHGALVLWGRCYEGDGAPAFWPWLQTIRAVVRSADPGALRAALGPGAAIVAELVPELRARLGGLADLAPPPPLEPAAARFRLFDTLTTFLRTAASARPLVLILEDLHWADVPSLRLLEFLAGELRAAHLLVIGTYRDTELLADHPLSATLAALAREPATLRLTVPGLAEAEVAQLIAHLAGAPPLPQLVAALHHTTEGNPFFVTEIVRLLVAEGRLADPVDDAGWRLETPPSVREAVGQRLARLSVSCQRVLTIAAVVGREFSLRALGQVSELAGEGLLEVLEEAETARVISAVAGAAGRYRFVHALIRETLYTELPAMRRMRLHRQVGEALERLYRGNAEPHLAELAHHFLEASPGGEATKAVEYARQAAERARAQLAYEEAVRHYALALEALELEDSVDAAQRYDLLMELGTAQHAATDFHGIRDTYERAAAVARQLGWPEHLARAALGFSWSWLVTREDTTAIDLLTEALRVLDEEDSALRAMMLARLARYAVFPDDAPADRAAVLAREAIAMARRAGDTAALLSALNDAYWVVQGPDEIEERLGFATEIVRLATASGDRAWVWRGHSRRLPVLLELGDIGVVDRELSVHARLAEELRWTESQNEAASYRAMRALLAGDFEAGERLGRQALAIAERAQVPAWLSSFTVRQFIVRREQGRLAELEAEVEALVERSPERPTFWCLRALLYLELGHEAQARAEFERLAGAAPDFGGARLDLNRVLALPLLGELCARLGDGGRAAAIYRLLLPYDGRNLAITPICLGAASRYLGLLATTMGWWKTATRHFEEALALNARMGARPWLAHTQYDYADMLLRRMTARGGRLPRQASAETTDRALTLLDQALATAQALGMSRLAEQALALKDRTAQLLADGAPGSAAHVDSADVLTAREVEVLRLLARGLSNKAIAETLVVSVRTAEHHIAGIYAKVGAHNRAEATTYALRNGLLPPATVLP